MIRLNIVVIFTAFLTFPIFSQAGLGVYAGTGVPHQSQVGLTYEFGKSYMLEISNNHGNSLTACKKFDLNVVQVGAYVFPSDGVFFVGGGFGHTNLTAGQVDPTTQIEFNMKGDALRAYLKLGWIWGRANNGFWFGMDLSAYQSLSSKKEINASGVDTNSVEYRSVEDALKVFVETSSLNITLARIGWSF